MVCLVDKIIFKEDNIIVRNMSTYKNDVCINYNDIKSVSHKINSKDMLIKYNKNGKNKTKEATLENEKTCDDVLNILSSHLSDKKLNARDMNNNEKIYLYTSSIMKTLLCIIVFLLLVYGINFSNTESVSLPIYFIPFYYIANKVSLPILLIVFVMILALAICITSIDINRSSKISIIE